MLKELLRRKRAQESLIDFSKSVIIPGAPIAGLAAGDLENAPDLEPVLDKDGNPKLTKSGRPKMRLRPSWVYEPVEAAVAKHHALMMRKIQECIEKPSGRLMIFAPPGSAKSTYVSVVGPTWAMGKFPGIQVLMTGYAGIPIWRHAKRARQLAGSPEYRTLWDKPVTIVGRAKHDWELSNGSRMYSAGLQGSITSTRCDLGIIDDPVAGRKEADSEIERRNVRQAYDDDFLTRLKPDASIILIQTRWHEDDLAGGILPEGWEGQSGTFLCRDGQEWEVLCLEAECTRKDDPLGRKVGEMLWGEWFNDRHWLNYRSNPRTWSALFQQNPQPQSGGQFEKAWFHRFNMADMPKAVTRFMSGDWAVTELTLDTHPDYTVHGAWSMDSAGDLWLMGGWNGMQDPVKSITEWIKLLLQFKPTDYAAEAGVIRRAIEPMLNAAQKEVEQYVTYEWQPHVGDKIANAAAFRALASHGKVHIINGPFGDWVIAQLCAFPFGRYDDAVDMCGQAGRFADLLRRPEDEPDEEKIREQRNVKPFTEQMWERYSEQDERRERRKREYTE